MTHLSAGPPPPPSLAMPISYGGPSASSQAAFFPHLIADFQRSLHSRLLSVVHSVSTSATTASPLSVHQWLQEQLVACLDAEKRYILHSPPPPSLLSQPALSSPTISSAQSAPQQLSNALNELTLSAAEAINNASRQRQQQVQQQQQVEPFSRREEEHKKTDVSDTEGADERATATHYTAATAPVPRRSSLSRSHLRPHHHHHHGHAVEVSVRCLPSPSTVPIMAAAYSRPHSHDEDDDNNNNNNNNNNSRTSAGAYTHTASTSYTLSTAVTTKREREDSSAGTTRSASPPCCSPPGHSSFLSPLPCLPNCNLPSLSPCLSSSPCLDFNCLDPTPLLAVRRRSAVLLPVIRSDG